jgi:hypothetical protein
MLFDKYEPDSDMRESMQKYIFFVQRRFGTTVAPFHVSVRGSQLMTPR